MAKDKVGKTLSSLSEVDKEIQEYRVKLSAMNETQENLTSDLSQTQQRLEDLEAAFKDADQRRKLEEERLKEEETKIIERRRQLTTIGGAKSAKLVERELDIATRVLETMEKTTMEAIEASDVLREQVSGFSDRAAHISQELERLTEENQPEIESIGKDLAKLDKQRVALLSKLDARLQSLYDRVNKRYPGEAISFAGDGACNSCFRALPQQTYNQVMAGNVLIQCPGCSRILIYSLD